MCLCFLFLFVCLLVGGRGSKLLRKCFPRELHIKLIAKIALVELVLLEKYSILLLKVHQLRGCKIFWFCFGMGSLFLEEGGSNMWKTHWREKYKYTFLYFFLIGIVSGVFKQFHNWIGCL